MTDFEHVVLGYKPAKPVDIGKGRFGAKLISFPPSLVKGVLKFRQFSTARIRGVPKPEMHKREVAAYHLDRDVLGFHVVPPAMLIRYGGREASISEYVDGLMPRQVVPHLFKDTEGKKERLARFFAKVNMDDAMRIVLFDLVINNTDRHGLNVLVKHPDNRLAAIDNGMSFGRAFRYYRNVLHRYAFLHNFDVPTHLLAHLGKVKRSQIAAAIGPYVGKREVEDTWRRLQFVIDHAEHLDFHTLSKGQYEKNAFPTYAEKFDRQPGPSIPLVVGPFAAGGIS